MDVVHRQSEGTGLPRARVTARDVAQAAGVSVAVVSYAFSRPDRVSSVTRQRVLATAAALGYTGPDPAGRALRLGRPGAVALVSDQSLEGLLSDPAALLVGRGVARACDRAGMGLVLGPTSPGATDGAVVVGGRAAATVTPGSRRVVIVDGPDVPGVSRVSAQVRQGAAHLATYLAGLGHRSLAVLARPEDGERIAGIREGWGAAGPVHVYEVSGPTQSHGEIAARRALRDGADAVVGLTDRLALGALVAARHLDRGTPEQVSVAGMDDLPGSDAAGLTTVFVPYLPMGELAGDLLLGLVAGTPRPSPPELPTALTVRTSTRAARINPRRS